MPTPIIGVQDGPRLAVSQLVKQPTVIQRRILSMMNQMFLVDALLRKGNDAPSGAVLYYETTPLFTTDSPVVIDEFGEIPTTNGTMGIPKVVKTVMRAMGLRVSKRMIDRNNVDAVNSQLLQIRNTMIRAWEDAFLSALIANASVQTMTTDTYWGASGSHIRKDVNSAKFLIANASADGNGQNGTNKLGYVADTLVISTSTQTDFLDSNEVSLPYVGNIADENLLYTGKLPNKFLGLDVVVSWRLDTYANGTAIVLERMTLGGISDERGLYATPLYPEGNGPNGGPTESWRSDTGRMSAIFLDQPLAAVVISGVHA
jgi:hypothetical protein